MGKLGKLAAYARFVSKRSSAHFLNFLCHGMTGLFYFDLLKFGRILKSKKCGRTTVCTCECTTRLELRYVTQKQSYTHGLALRPQDATFDTDEIQNGMIVCTLVVCH